MQGIPRDKVITLIRGNDLIALNDEVKRKGYGAFSPFTTKKIDLLRAALV